MAGDVIVLLSSDDLDPSTTPFVTDKAISARPEDSLPQRRTGVEAAAAAVAAETSGVRHAAPVGVAGTPAAASKTKSARGPSRFGLFEFSSDDASSPFPSAHSRNKTKSVQTPRRARTETSRGQNRERSVVILSDSAHEIDKSYNGKDTSPCHRAADLILEDLAAGDEARPWKRLRASSVSSIADATVPDISRAADADDDLPRRNLPTISLQSSQIESRLHTQATPANTAPTNSNQSSQDPAELRAPPADSTRFIDLLSSSSSEAGRTASSRERPSINNTDFEELDDLFMDPYPDLEDVAWTRKTTRVENKNELPVEKERLVEILSLTSSSPLPPRSTSASNTQRPSLNRSYDIDMPPQQATFGAQATSSRTASRSLHQRSLLEGHGLEFIDDDDDSDTGNTPNFATINSLLAAWRGNEEAEERQTTTPGHVQRARKTAAREGGKEARRRDKDADQEQRQYEREVEKQKKQQEKAVERERRRIAAQIAKEKKAAERAATAAFNEANKSRTDKSVAAPEMVVRLPSTLSQATREVLEPMLAEIRVELETWTSPADSVAVTWRRKVTSEYRADLGHWVPVPLRLDDEKHVLVVLRGEELVKLILARDPEDRRRTDDLGGHVRTMRRHFPGHSILYVVEGLAAWKSKNKAIRNRQFVEAVRGARDGGGAGDGASSRGTQRRTGRGQAAIRGGRAAGAAAAAGTAARPGPPQHVDETVVEDGLLALQVEHGVLVHESGQPLETARWIRAFTEQIATGRYRQQKEREYAAAASFCMDAGQVATGDGAADTFALMLQQIGRVTEPVALGVAARFDSVPKLVRGLAAEGPLALEACLKSRNRNGALSDRTIGPALSRRIYKVFMGEDEASTDI